MGQAEGSVGGSLPPIYPSGTAPGERMAPNQEAFGQSAAARGGTAYVFL